MLLSPHRYGEPDSSKQAEHNRPLETAASQLPGIGTHVLRCRAAVISLLAQRISPAPS